jgi:hypothetical protein
VHRAPVVRAAVMHVVVVAIDADRRLPRAS